MGHWLEEEHVERAAVEVEEMAQSPAEHEETEEIVHLGTFACDTQQWGARHRRARSRWTSIQL